MENDKSKNEEPLLYIQQPKFGKPERVMQESYISSSKIVEPREEETSQSQEQKQKKPLYFQKPLKSDDLEISFEDDWESSSEDEIQEEPSEKPMSAADYFRRNTSIKKNKSWNLNPVKSFKNMSITEKLEYLNGFPSNQPPYPCEFIAKQERFKGTLGKYSKDQIIINILNGESVTINVHDIEAIRIIF